MKKLFLLFALVGMFATACEEGGVNEPTNTPTEKPDDGNGETPDDAYLTITMEVITFSPDGESVDIKVYSNYAWELTNNCDWVTTSVTGGEASDAGTTVTLTADLTYDDREGTITFSCGKAKKLLVVSQSFKEAIIADENNTFNVSVDGGTVELAYQTNVECEVIIPEEAQSWISLADDTRGLVNESVVLNIAPNNSGAEKSAIIKVVKVEDTSISTEYIITQERNMDYIIFYTTTNGETIRPYYFDYLTNTYEDGVGMLAFDGSKVTSIGNGAFSYCTSLTSITIPDSVTEIGYLAFYGCTSLTSIYGKFTSDDNRCLIANGELIAFAIGCGATEYTIPDSVTKIGEQTFEDCTSLTSVTIGNSVTEIGFAAFFNCTSLTSVYCKPTTPPTGDYQMFNNNASGRKIYVPAESVDAYKSAEDWSEYADAIVGYDFEKGEVVEKVDVYLYADHAEVYTAEGLLQWAYIVNNGAISAFEGIGGYDAATFDKNAYGLKVMTNIKMPAFTIVADTEAETYIFTDEAITVTDGVASGSNWNPVCSQISVLEDAYSGWVEGQNKTISGLRINTNANYVAFIGFIFDGVFVKNLTFNDAYVNGATNVGVVAGRAQDDTLIENVRVANSTVSASAQAGAIVGYNYSRVGGVQGYSEGPAIVRNCSNDANTKVVATGDNVGGIVGTNYAGTIYNCQNYADVTGRSSVGGIAGYTRDYYDNKDGYIIACTSYSDATITATKEKGYIGGIAGSTLADNLHTNTYTHIVACASFSEVVGGAESKKGAIIGMILQDQHTVGCVAIKNGVTDLYGSGKPTTDSGIKDAILYDAAYGATQSDVDALNAAITHYNGKNPPSEAYCNFTWALVNGFPVLR